MKVDKTQIFLDDEDEMIAIAVTLNVLYRGYEEMPRWMFIKKEWNEYLIEKQKLQKRLSKLKEKLG